MIVCGGKGYIDLFFIIMRRILLLLAVLMLAISAQAQPTTLLSYLADYEAEDRQDFLELTVEVTSFKSSLQ